MTKRWLKAWCRYLDTFSDFGWWGFLLTDLPYPSGASGKVGEIYRSGTSVWSRPPAEARPLAADQALCLLGSEPPGRSPLSALAFASLLGSSRHRRRGRRSRGGEVVLQPAFGLTEGLAPPMPTAVGGGALAECLRGMYYPVRRTFGPFAVAPPLQRDRGGLFSCPSRYAPLLRPVKPSFRRGNLRSLPKTIPARLPWRAGVGCWRSSQYETNHLSEKEPLPGRCSRHGPKSTTPGRGLLLVGSLDSWP